MTPDPHAWVRARLDAHALGLLGEADELRFTEHLAGCAECARAHELFSANLPDGEPPAEHLPPSVVARWASARTALRGLERRLVREHLEGCEACRGELRTLGHDPMLAADEALEAALPADTARRPGHGAPRATHATQQVGSPRGRLLDWLIGGAGGALVASGAWLLLVVMGPLANRPIVVSAPAPVPEAGEIRLPSLSVLRDPIRLPAGTRSSGGAQPVVVRIDSTTRSIQLRLPEGNGTPDSPVRVMVCWPGGAATEATFRFRDVAARAAVLLSAREPLQPGDYEITTTFGPEAGQPESAALVVHSTLRLTYARR